MSGQNVNQQSQYNYANMSNLVLQADRRLGSGRRSDEATGEAESLAGRVSMKDMGTRLSRHTAPKDKIKKPKASEDEGAKKKKKDTGGFAGLSAATDFAVEDIRYRPRTKETRDIFDLMLSIVLEELGDVTHDTVRSAADLILETLKAEGVKDFDKKKEIDDTLGTVLSQKRFNELMNLSKKITDYDADEDEDMGGTKDGETDALDDRQGVAVVFGESDDDDEDAPGTYEVRDDDDADTSDEEDADGEPAKKSDEDEEGSDADEPGDNELVIDARKAGLQKTKKDTDSDKTVVPAHVIDAFWLQRQLGAVFTDPHEAAAKTATTMDILEAPEEEKSLRQVENDLMELFEYEHFEVVQLLTRNRDKVVWCTRLAKAEDGKEREAIKKDMIAEGLRHILIELDAREGGPKTTEKPTMKADLMDIDIPSAAEKKQQAQASSALQPRKTIDLETLVFEQGNHLMTNPSVKLPQGSTKRTFKGYEEIHVPIPKKRNDAEEPPLIQVSSLPEWAQHPFLKSKSHTLNRVQTRCYSSAFEGDGNMLICAPTGSGKTNVGMLTMLREIGKHRDPKTGRIKLDEFKIVYIAPLKALVQEQVGNFGKRLEHYGVKVAELTGDRQLTKAQIAETQVIVSTPEKWDVITRKATDTSYTNLVRLIIIDEIHLLHDDRGPVLESIVSRTIRKQEQTLDPVRLVGLSATLPNYRDVASFLHVDASKDLFHFDASFRPCPLKQEFIGITEKKAIKQLQTMNEVAYTKVIEQASKNQMLIFVHSRKDTHKTAKYIRDKAVELETIGQILRSDAASREILRETADQVADANLKDILPYGFGIHHAGMNRVDRTTVEDLFNEGFIQVLVCTATLAWGVNLPAHTVIIKGTQVYSPEKGAWVELSPQDTLQMLGRAGRPQFDTYGEGIIITTSAEMQYYLSLLNQQLPIESQLVSKLIDSLNAEIVLGTVRNREDAVEWLGYTYLYVRMLRSPGIYNVGADYGDDEALLQKRVDLVHSAAVALEKCKLIKYDKKTGKFQSTEFGRIASHYYITYRSMHTYNQHLQPDIGPIELFRVFSLSEEFKYIPVRQEEKAELAKLITAVPIPIKEGIEEPQSKINVLLQAYISRLKLDGLALMADMVYVTQSAGRILRAIFEMCLKYEWSSVAKLALNMCKTAEKRMWPTMTPMRQFPTCPPEVIRKLERMDIEWTHFFNLDPPEIEEAISMPKVGRQIHELLQKFPRLDVQAQVQPVTRSLLRVEMTITPEFTWDESLHGLAESFWIFAEDCDGNKILFHDQFILKKQYLEGEDNQHLVEFTVPITTDPMPPNYFFSVISDRWMHSETKLAVSFKKLILPEKFPPHTPLLDLQPLPTTALKRRELVDLFPEWDNFNKIQTQTFNSLFSSDDNVFVGSPTGSGKTVCAEFALFRHWSQKGHGRAVYIAPFQELVDNRYGEWKERLAGITGGKEIVKLTGETTADLRLLEKGDLILATPTQWDSLSRSWQRRKNVQTVGLFIADDVHMLGGQGGYIYEVILARTNYISTQTEKPCRMVALSVSLSNARDIGEWIGATQHNIYNFHPLSRPVPLEIHIQSFTIPHFPSLMLAMVKPVFQAILQHAGDQPAIIFVPGRKLCRTIAMELLSYCVAADDEDKFLQADLSDLTPILGRVQDKALAESLSHGIGYLHEALSKSDKRIVKNLYDSGAVQVLLASRDVCWELTSTCHLVVIMNTQFFDGREHRYIDYPLSEVLQMFGRASRPLDDKIGKALLLLPAVRKNYYVKFVNEALPIESHLQTYLPDALVAEISTKMVTSTQDAVDWSTLTYFYRRLLANPSFYGLTDISHEGLSLHLSELVENTLKELADAKVIDLDEEDDTVTPLNAAMISAYYNISFITMQTFLLSLNARTKLKGLLEIVTSSTEFETVQLRRHEESVLRRIHERLPVKMSEPINYESAHFKAYVLVQAHFSRLQLPPDLAADQAVMLGKIINLLNACVDVLSSEGHINAMRAMELSQMVVQAMWDVSRDSPLKQIPFFTPEVIKVANSFGVKRVFEFIDEMAPDSENREELLGKLGLDQKQLAQVANFTNNKYPDIDFEATLEDEDQIVAGSASYVNVKMERNIDEDEEPDMTVHAPFFPQQKMEGWWVVVGDDTTNSLLAIKRLTLSRKQELKLEYVVPTPGKHKLTVYLMSDSYVDVDQELNFEVDVAEGMDEDEEEEEDSE